MHITNNRFELEGNEFDLKFTKSPNSAAQRKLTHFIIHCTEGPSVTAAVDEFSKPQNTSTHLILGKDGRELVQMVDFNRAGVHAPQYNNRSLGIELDYPGDIRPINDPKRKYKWLTSYQENQYIQARSYNMDNRDSSYRFWPLYQKAQLETLLGITQQLVDHYGITEVFGHEELQTNKADPGPAFPIYHFREKLRGISNPPPVLQETIRAVRVRSRPDPASVLLLPESLIPPRTPVVVTNEKNGWVLIQVMAEVDGNPWIVGWVEQGGVQVRRDPLTVNHHHLVASERRQFPFIEIPPDNFGEKEFIKKHKYVIMHISTGTNMQSTIDYFRNPLNKVSSHLLIGRDGRIVQFVPFDKKAYHAGDSWWEGDANINDFSIGIELDNAGFLKAEPDGRWTRVGTPVPSERVVMKTHWRENRERAWEDFTQIQLDVTMDVLKALKDAYKIEEILGHDQVNLRDRVDPGPLFPLEDFRAQLFNGRREPVIKEYQITQETKIYALANGEPPDLKHSTFKEKLEKKAVVEIKQKGKDWSLVIVVNKSGLSGQTGWVKTNSLEATDKVAKFKSSVLQTLFKNAKTPPPTEILGGPFPAGTRIRLQEERENWSLVAVLDTVKNLKGLQGWVPKEFTNIGQGLRGGRSR